jgi:hypothetical protein
MKKNPGLWLVILIIVVGWNLYEIVGPHDEAPSQGVLVLNWVALVCAAAGLIGVVMQIVQQNKRGA